jgi:hypothetical protein
MPHKAKQNVTIEKLASLQAKNDVALKELQRAQAATSLLIAEMIETVKNTGIQVTDNSLTVKSIGQQLGNIGRNQGEVAEEYFYNSLRANPMLGEVKFDTIQANVEAGNKKYQAEFDMLMNNGNSAAVLEVKYKVHSTDLDHLEKNIKRYREVFPQHKHFKLYGGIAGFSISPAVTKAAKERGLFVLKRKGEVFTADTVDMRVF